MVYGNYRTAISIYEGGDNIRTVPGYSNTSTAGVGTLMTIYPIKLLTYIRFSAHIPNLSWYVASVFRDFIFANNTTESIRPILQRIHRQCASHVLDLRSKRCESLPSPMQDHVTDLDERMPTLVPET